MFFFTTQLMLTDAMTTSSNCLLLLFPFYVFAVSHGQFLSVQEQCQIPPVDNGYFLFEEEPASPGDSINEGDAITLVCNRGYRLMIGDTPAGQSITVGCMPNGNWELNQFGQCIPNITTTNSTTPPPGQATASMFSSSYAECGGLPVLLPNGSIGGRSRPQQIIGGEFTTIYDYPWMAKLLIAFRGSLTPSLCSGNVISADWILTAAHCFDSDRKVINVTIYLGRTNFTSSSYEKNPDPADTRYANAYAIHPNYVNLTVASTQHFDFALLRISPPILFKDTIRPICLPDDSNLCDQDVNPYSPRIDTCIQVSSAGWGLTDDSLGRGSLESTSKQLKRIDLTTYSQETCEMMSLKWNGYRRNITDVQICAGRHEANQDTCRGDSGGPLMCKSQRNNKINIIGLVSLGDGCGQAGLPAVYSRVCHSRVISWIRQITGLQKLTLTTTTTQKPSTTTKQQQNGCVIPNVAHGSYNRTGPPAATPIQGLRTPTATATTLASYGEKITLICDANYDLKHSTSNTAQSNTSLCQKNGTWAPVQVGTCERTATNITHHSQHMQECRQFAVTSRTSNISTLVVPKVTKAIAYWPLNAISQLTDVTPNEVELLPLLQPGSYDYVDEDDESGNLGLYRGTGPFGRKNTSYNSGRNVGLIANLAKRPTTSFTISFYVKQQQGRSKANTSSILLTISDDDRNDRLSLIWKKPSALQIKGVNGTMSRQFTSVFIPAKNYWNFVAIIYDYEEAMLAVYGLVAETTQDKSTNRTTTSNVLKRLGHVADIDVRFISGWPSNSAAIIAASGGDATFQLACLAIYGDVLRPQDLNDERQFCRCHHLMHDLL